MEICLECEPFKANMDAESLEETLKVFRRQYKETKHLIEQRDQQLETINREMAAGLFEVFEALKEIASGDPSVRIPETSKLELIAKLKQMVNLTAQNLAEIVDLSHEFAIGLAEHFDVLNRVSTGDLSARISGVTQIEILELLKDITNQMIENVSREISERKQAQAVIMQSEEKHRILIDNIQDGVFIIVDGKMQFVNEAFAKMVGYSAAEIVGLDFEQLVAPEDLKKVVQRYRRRLAGERVEKEYEFRLLHKDGMARVFVNMNVGLFNYQNDLASMGTVKNITDRKSAEEEKRKLEARLVRAQKMEAIGTLAGGVAHDLNNILSGIVSYPELLLMDMPQDNYLRKPILTIQKSGEKAAAIVQDLLTLARRGVVVTEVVELNRIVTDYLKSPEHEKLKLYHPGIQVETNLETNLMNTMGSPLHLSKTVMNLISNAAEAMTNGDRIVITTGNRYIDRSIAGYDHVKEGDYVTLTVSDTGIGISKEDMERIFEPFYTKKVMGKSGTGLGMAVVWGTVKDHDGYIDVKSTEGKGTAFTLYFPATRKEFEKEKPLLSIAGYRGRGESVLVVDDVAEQREIASMMLTKLGYAVTSVSSGEAAIDYLKSHVADLLVLDMIMEPGLDGLETYKKIIERHPGQRAIIASGFSETDRVKAAQLLGAGAYIKKPYLLEKIGVAVRDELDK